MTWREILARHLPEHAQRAGKDTLEMLVVRLPNAEGGITPQTALPDVLELLSRVHHDLTRARLTHGKHAALLAAARTEVSRRNALTEVLLASRPSTGITADSAGDLRALDRALDEGAIRERDLLDRHRLSQQWEFLACTVVGLFGEIPAGDGVPDPIAEVAARNALHEAARVPEGGAGRTPASADLVEGWPLRAAACRLLGRLGRAFPARRAEAGQALLDRIGSYRDEVWVQTAALEAYCEIAPEHAAGLLAGCVSPPSSLAPSLPSDHRFVRARAVALAGRHGLWDLVERALSDESEHVRIEAVRALGSGKEIARLERVLAKEPSRVVRAAGRVSMLPESLEAVVAGLSPTEDPWAVEVLLSAILARRAEIAKLPARLDAASAALSDGLAHWSQNGPNDVREMCGLLRRWLSVVTVPGRAGAFLELSNWLAEAKEGDASNFTFGLLASLPAPDLLEVLALAATDGFDLSADPISGGWRVHVGTQDEFAPWRLLYELSHPAPDKRQAHHHTTDRTHPGRLIALSPGLAEATATRVPGQRVAGPSTLSWGSHLPLPSLVVSAARHGSVEVVTPTGTMTLTRRESRLRGRIAAQSRYVPLARLREQLLARNDERAVERYDEALSKAGFDVKRDGTKLLGGMSVGIGGILPEYRDVLSELVRIDANTVGELAVVSLLVGAMWTGRNFAMHRETLRLRERIPLVIGGWGSRGKSGTERLKASLFHGLGYRVVSKTTGCEAMVITSVPGSKPTEIFLYRPYDKATVWEVRQVLQMASGFDAQVLLWECMGLKADYVELLQHDWMKDDISTITNTYPDHEDVQGPTGRDVADSICAFIPKNALALTTEEQMVPVLVARARALKTELVSVHAEEWSLLPSDLLARFPYAEHPRNVALVVRMAKELGIDRDVALKEMSDSVVPDIGVLKEYGPIRHRDRTLTFVNGMSANERAGFLSNWERMALDTSSDASGLDQRLTILVNNREDRLTRQDAFVRIALDDAPADALFIIGTNVGSFAAHYRRGLDAFVRPELRAIAASNGPAALAREIGRRLRRRPLPQDTALARAIAFAGEPARERLTAQAATSWGESPVFMTAALAAGSAEEAAMQWLSETAFVWRLHEKPEAIDPDTAVAHLVALLAGRLVSIDDPSITGDRLLDRLSLASPAGSVTRILGCQNIKGTGLDFVYRWLAVDKVSTLLANLEAADSTEARLLLEALARHDDQGFADAALVVDVLGRIVKAGRLRMFGLNELAETILGKNRTFLAVAERAMAAGQEEKGWRGILAGWLESFLDITDSILRKRAAESLYADLIARRISPDRAALVAKDLVARDKGGWLTTPD